jgi:cysteinyl-tRNA synthetase
MSKSIGNIFSINQALQKYPPESLRMFFLTSHYRSPLVFDEESIIAQSKAITRLHSASEAISGDTTPLPSEEYKRKFIDVMDEDFNTPKALAVIFDLARDINRESVKGRDVSEAQKLLNELTQVLGLNINQSIANTKTDAAPFIDLLLDVRNDLRSSKQFGLADSIRDRLEKLNVIIEDSKENTIWKTNY